MKTALVFSGFIIAAAVGWYAAQTFSRPPLVPPASEEEVFAPPKMPSGNEGIVAALSGEAFVKRGAVWKSLEPGDPVTASDTVKVTEGGSCEIQFGGLAVLRIRENTVAELKAVVSSGGKPELGLRLAAGTVLCKVKKAVGLVNVETAVGVLGVRGTEFLVRQTEAGAFVAVKEGLVAFEGGEEIPVGFQYLKPAEEKAVKAKPEASPPAVREELAALDRMRLLDLPDSGIPRLTRIVLATEPKDARILDDGVLVGRGEYSRLVPYGEILRFVVEKDGYKRRTVEIPVFSQEAGKRYIIRLEVDPATDAAGPPAEKPRAAGSAPTEERIGKLVEEIKTLNERNKALSVQWNALASEKDALQRKVSALEAEIATLVMKLEEETAKAKEAAEKLEGKR